jgi:hypothetical protein
MGSDVISIVIAHTIGTGTGYLLQKTASQYERLKPLRHLHLEACVSFLGRGPD